MQRVTIFLTKSWPTVVSSQYLILANSYTFGVRKVFLPYKSLVLTPELKFDVIEVTRKSVPRQSKRIKKILASRTRKFYRFF